MNSIRTAMAAFALSLFALPVFANNPVVKTPIFGVPERKPAQISAPIAIMTSNCKSRNGKGETTVTYYVTKSGSGDTAWYNMHKVNIQFKNMGENFGLGDFEIKTEGMSWDSEAKMKEEAPFLPTKYMIYRSVTNSMGIMQLPSFYILFGSTGQGGGVLSIKNLESTEFNVEMLCTRKT